MDGWMDGWDRAPWALRLHMERMWWAAAVIVRAAVPPSARPRCAPTHLLARVET